MKIIKAKTYLWSHDDGRGTDVQRVQYHLEGDSSRIQSREHILVLGGNFLDVITSSKKGKKNKE